MENSGSREISPVMEIRAPSKALKWFKPDF